MIRKIAKIKSTMLGYEDHGIPTAVLNVDYGGSYQGVGCHDLRYEHYGIEYLMRVLDACGVRKWEQLVGRTVYVLFDDDSSIPIGIEPLPTEGGKRLIFSELAEP